ncbi:MAG: VWA domain-containing protein [Planctomycetota bacterium]
MQSSDLPDNLYGADPQSLRRRWAIPSWLLSLVVHTGAFVLLATLTFGAAKSLPGERTLNVGILVEREGIESDENEELLPESDATAKGVAPFPAEVTALEKEPVTEPEKQPLPLEESENAILATAGQTLRDANNAYPIPKQLLDGGRVRTEFFNAASVGKSFVFVIDRSASMAHRDSLGMAKREVQRALGKLTPDCSFQIIFYNTEHEFLFPNESALLPATPANLKRSYERLRQIGPSGGTEHNGALEAAFQLHPEVIYFLTDADMMSRRDVRMLTDKNRLSGEAATIYAIEFGNGPNLAEENPLRLLAQENDGTYVYVNVQGQESSDARQP